MLSKTTAQVRLMHDLCLELPRIQERIFRAGLLKTGHAMNAAVQAIGFETAEYSEDLERRLEGEEE